MKYLFILFSFCYLTTQAQVDTTKLPVTLQFKVKHIGYMANLLADNNSLADKNIRDSLVKYIGSGNTPDSVVIAHLKAGYVLGFLKYLFNEQASTTYSVLYELGNGASGYTGLVSQLIAKGTNNNDLEEGVARWLYFQIMAILNHGTTIMNNNFSDGKIWLLNPIIQH